MKRKLPERCKALEKLENLYNDALEEMREASKKAEKALGDSITYRWKLIRHSCECLLCKENAKKIQSISDTDF